MFFRIFCRLKSPICRLDYTPVAHTGHIFRFSWVPVICRFDCRFGLIPYLQIDYLWPSFTVHQKRYRYKDNKICRGFCLAMVFVSPWFLSHFAQNLFCWMWNMYYFFVATHVNYFFIRSCVSWSWSQFQSLLILFNKSPVFMIRKVSTLWHIDHEGYMSARHKVVISRSTASVV